MEELKCECSAIVTHSLIVCEEKRSKITFENKTKKEINKVQVDGCQITDQNNHKCDYLLVDNELSIEYFIELKGHDINHALRQIEATIPRLSQSAQQQTKYCFIISFRTPMASTEIQIKQREFKRKYNATLIIKSSPYNHLL
ncbi:hypothetical protein CLV62_12445 [Dysgonomonas alginatilytica]|uniref:Uncharacterized protein n=1 Tax=Dysgonomonas alginatilytica TaxID=1605892 RepID=A0A2V3PL66_9BACT|nr:hypothetical protein [Dysgonomonas alginatilytica]PXV61890.1 hypothetical protein CLV62_12445 [Dysgonomonas alginatilytica]